MVTIKDLSIEQELIGLKLEEAMPIIKERGFEHRIVSKDGMCFMMTMDIMENRVNLELVKGIIVKAQIF